MTSEFSSTFGRNTDFLFHKKIFTLASCATDISRRQQPLEVWRQCRDNAEFSPNFKKIFSSHYWKTSFMIFFKTLPGSVYSFKISNYTYAALLLPWLTSKILLSPPWIMRKLCASDFKQQNHSLATSRLRWNVWISD